MDLVDTIRRETRHAARSLARTPSFSLIVVVTLALGLGAATTIFTLLDRVVLRPLPYPNADRLIHIGTSGPRRSSRRGIRDLEGTVLLLPEATAESSPT